MLRNEKRPSGHQSSKSRKQVTKTTQLQIHVTFLWERKDDSEWIAKSPEGGAKNHGEKLLGCFWVRMGSDQGTFDICPTGFQNCCGPVIPVCSPFPYFLNRSVFGSYSMPVPSLDVGYVGGRQLVSLVHRPADWEELYLRCFATPRPDWGDEILDLKLML